MKVQWMGRYAPGVGAYYAGLVSFFIKGFP